MRILVGVHEGGFNGIDTYAEQVAAALDANGADVTLLTANRDVAIQSSSRLEGTEVQIIDMDLPMPGRGTETAQRLWHGVRMHRLCNAIHNSLSRHNQHFDVIHLNHPGLSESVHAWGRVIVTAAWFYPHSFTGRIKETWKHTRGNIFRRLIINAKSTAFFLSDNSGYHKSDLVVCPTRTLADQLLSQKIPAEICPPPVRVTASVSNITETCFSDLHQLLVCCGDLSHPRKNVMDALLAVGMLPTDMGKVRLMLVGGNSDYLTKQARLLPEHIEAVFPGKLPPVELHELMRKSSALLIPSLYEEWGYVAVESLLCGTPVVSYPVYPFQDMLASGLGTIAEKVSAKSLSEAIQKQLKSGKKGELYEKALEKYSSINIGRKLLTLYDNIKSTGVKQKATHCVSDSGTSDAKTEGSSEISGNSFKIIPEKICSRTLDGK